MRGEKLWIEVTVTRSAREWMELERGRRRDGRRMRSKGGKEGRGKVEDGEMSERTELLRIEEVVGMIIN